MPKFTDQMPEWATEKDCNCPWMGGPKGKYFRCAMCGHQFKIGDYYRWQFTNNTEFPGNPLLCINCDSEKDQAIANWGRMCKEWEGIKKKYWFFIRNLPVDKDGVIEI